MVRPDELSSLPRPLAFVMPGGGALGGYQVGVLKALTEAGVTPDLLVGVSAGAVNAAMFAWNPGVDGVAHIESVWRSIRRRDLIRFHPARMVLALVGRFPSFLDNQHGRRWLERHLGDRLIAAIAECESVCEHLHLPVQAGDDLVLRRMGRQYTVDAYLGLVERLRAAVPGIALLTVHPGSAGSDP